MRINSAKVELALAKECILMKELCQRAEITPISLKRILSGAVNPRPATVGKIAKALNVNVQEIIMEE